MDVTHLKTAGPLLAHFHVVGPPSFVFLDPTGQEIQALTPDRHRPGNFRTPFLIKQAQHYAQR